MKQLQPFTGDFSAGRLNCATCGRSTPVALLQSDTSTIPHKHHCAGCAGLLSAIEAMPVSECEREAMKKAYTSVTTH